jgi:hypothetical protein
MKITLKTTERDLEDLMIKEYPGLITGEQHQVMRKQDYKIYLFKDLDFQQAREFLEDYKQYEFQLVDKNGFLIHGNYPQLVNYN